VRALVFGVPPEPFEVSDDAGVLTLVVDGRVDLSPMLTHTFRLEHWREAFLAIANQGDSGAVKVAIDFR
jgi:threonine dehydrogenase-like Zn-dependent dehydrogenase